MDIFKIPKNKTTGMYIEKVEKLVDITTWKLLYPDNMNRVRDMKR